jgi:hypothetical protein
MPSSASTTSSYAEPRTITDTVELPERTERTERESGRAAVEEFPGHLSEQVVDRVAPEPNAKMKPLVSAMQAWSWYALLPH